MAAAVFVAAVLIELIDGVAYLPAPAADGAGEISLPLNFGLRIGPISLVMQYAVLDGAAINGVALSNALQLDKL